MTLWSIILVSLLYGPYQAKVVRVMDADTLKITVAVWPGQINQIVVRLTDIASPRKAGACETERLLAKEAQAFSSSFLGKKIFIEKLRHSRKDGGYYAVVRNQRGDDLGSALIAAGYAINKDDVEYSSWCPERP